MARMDGYASFDYNRTFSRPEMENALALYLTYTYREGIKPKVTTLDDIEEKHCGDYILDLAEDEQQRQYGGKVNFIEQVVLPRKEK